MLWGAAVLVVVAVAGFFSWMALVRAGILRYNKWDRRERGVLKVGDQAPDLELVRYDGSLLRLGSLWEGKPVLLVFGSCT
jgi:cytochrome oxidase Cu insertion factor (SCO1/SenC/PrrC family)